MNFLSEVVADTLSKNDQIEDSIFILPSKRSIQHLKKAFAAQMHKASFAPTFLTIEEFIQQLSGLRPISNTQLLFEFYSVYLELLPKEDQESFLSFSKWAPTILQDFNEIDRYLVDQQQIFSYLKAIKDLDHWSKKEQQGNLVTSYLKFWELLPELYETLTDKLVKQGVAYQGFIYREANDNIERYLQLKGTEVHYFVGFNALNQAEQNIIQSILHMGHSEAYWDIDASFISDEIHDAGLFQRVYKKSWKYYQHNPYLWLNNHFTSKKHIEIIGANNSVVQSKYAAQLLLKLKEKDEGLSSTALVLADEHTLPITLSSISETIASVNITMGLSLSLATVNSLFESLLRLYASSEAGFYHQNIVHVLSLPLVKNLLLFDGEDTAQHALNHIRHHNFSYVSLDILIGLFPEEVSGLTTLLFSTKNFSVTGFITNCLELISSLIATIAIEQTANEQLVKFQQIFNQLKLIHRSYDTLQDMKTLAMVYRELVRFEKLDFIGDPLEGLQVMGMLETRCLDFKNIILTSVNEGTLPSGKKNASFIPFDVKKQFGLPTYKEKDAIYTFHFYRLLQRAEHVFLLYTTEGDALNTLEKSRFLRQLQLDAQPEHTLKEFVINVPFHPSNTIHRTISKTPRIIDKLKELSAKGFSPSALTSYIRNPLDFYINKILGIEETEQLEETVAANTFGTIIHESLETLYQPFIGQELHSNLLTAQLALVHATVEKQYQKHYRAGNYAKGKNLISFNVACHFIKEYMQYEIKQLNQGHSIELIALEERIDDELQLEQLSHPIKVKGVVDRIDRFDGQLRILDFKTGKVTQTDLNLYDWEVLTQDYKYSKIFQVLMYAKMYTAKKGIDSNGIKAGIFSFKNLQGGFLPFQWKEHAHKGSTVITSDVLEAFTAQLKLLLSEIFDAAIPFTEKEV